MTEYATLFQQGTSNEDRPPVEDHTFDAFRYPARPPAPDEVEVLRRALVDCLTALEDNRPVPGNRIRAWRELAGTPYVDGAEPLEWGMEGSARAAAKWTDEETARVDAAIAKIAREKWDGFASTHAPAYVLELAAYPGRSDKCIEFTTADVWAELGQGFPVTKGIAGRMTSAKGAGIIASTGRTTYPPADAPGPNNGQRLTVWRAL